MTDDLMSVTGIEEITAENKFDFQLYPNPASSAFYIDFNLLSDEKVEIILFDLNGRMLESLVNEQLPAGFQSKFIQHGNLPVSGIYLITLKTGNTFVTKKLVFQK
jgi:hypothetical protein